MRREEQIMSSHLSPCPGHHSLGEEVLIPRISRVCVMHVITCSVNIRGVKGLMKPRVLFWKTKILS